MITQEEIKPFAELLECDQLADDAEKGLTYEGWEKHCAVTVKIGGKYARVDVGDSGKYMVVLETGEIFGIKGYGVIHRGHAYGTLETIHEWDWRGYNARKKSL